MKKTTYMEYKKTGTSRNPQQNNSKIGAICLIYAA
jgi:hypothetical protein